MQYFVVSPLIPKYMGYAIKTILLFIEWLTTKYCGWVAKKHNYYT